MFWCFETFINQYSCLTPFLEYEQYSTNITFTNIRNKAFFVDWDRMTRLEISFRLRNEF
jgi:hypothetical protein